MTPDTNRSTGGGTELGETRTVPDEDDRGKDVVDRRGQGIGVVTEIEGDTIYVDPHPSLTDKVMSKLGWAREEALPVSPRFVERIEDEVVLDVERDEQFREGAS